MTLKELIDWANTNANSIKTTKVHFERWDDKRNVPIPMDIKFMGMENKLNKKKRTLTVVLQDQPHQEV